MESGVLKKGEHVRNLRLALTNPVKLLKDINNKSSIHTFFGVFVIVGILLAVFATAMPYKQFEQVYMKASYDQHYLKGGIVEFTTDDTIDMMEEPYFRFPFYIVDFFWGDGLLILGSITFYWLALYAMTKGRRKYPIEYGEVANIFFISYMPIFMYQLGVMMYQYFTGVVTLVPYNSMTYHLWTVANPFVLYQIVIMALGIEKTLEMNKAISWGLVLICYGIWVIMKLQG